MQAAAALGCLPTKGLLLLLLKLALPLLLTLCQHVGQVLAGC